MNTTKRRMPLYICLALALVSQGIAAASTYAPHDSVVAPEISLDADWLPATRPPRPDLDLGLVIESAGDLTLTTRMDLREARLADGRGQSVFIVARGDVTITADVLAGHGEDGGFEDPAGAEGGHIVIESTSGRITVAAGILAGGNGGAGAADAGPGAKGGDGGSGGSIFLVAAEIRFQGELRPGDGGRGGEAWSTEPSDPHAVGGRGGDSGIVHPDRLSTFIRAASGGDGGNAHSYAQDPNGTAWLAGSDKGHPEADDMVCVDDPGEFPRGNTTATTPGPAWAVPEEEGRDAGNAATVGTAGAASCLPGVNAGSGQNATALAGDGGNGIRRGGNGGMAFARAGDGANVTVPFCEGLAGNGGWGGNATAHSGNGGIATQGHGGHGGSATAIAGSGGRGGIGQKAGLGGKGGWVNVTGGDGGAGLTGGGNGGSAIGRNGAGGPGGPGCPAKLPPTFMNEVGYAETIVGSLGVAAIAATVRRRRT